MMCPHPSVHNYVSPPFFCLQSCCTTCVARTKTSQPKLEGVADALGRFGACRKFACSQTSTRRPLRACSRLPQPSSGPTTRIATWPQNRIPGRNNRQMTAPILH
jgi:hypothetical protein